MKVWGLKSCDTCRKAVKALKLKFGEIEYVDVRSDGVSPSDLKRFYEAFGEDLVNRRSATYRGISEDERERDSLLLLAEYPTLMKRPVVDFEGILTLGWSKDVQAALIG